MAPRRTFTPQKLVCALLAWGSLPLLGAAPVISEFMASNNSSVADQDGAHVDWIEISNPGPSAVNLAGWYLTDKASAADKWQIPAVALQPGAQLVIFCSGKNYTDPTQPLATNFSLAAAGGYIALVEPDARTVASSYAYPVQYPDISYGVTQPTAPAEAPRVGYFAVATPGSANGNYTNLLLTDRVGLSVPAGLFTGSTTVALSGANAGEHIRYVLSTPAGTGAVPAGPTAASPLYTGPLTITSTQLLSAAVFAADDSQHGVTSSAVYLELDASSGSRADTFSSPLPLVVYDDNGFGPLPNNHQFYPGWFGAFSPSASGQTTLTQTPDLFTPETMNLHGYSSANFPKQSYELALTDDLGNPLNTPLFGLDADKRWDNISPWSIDLTYIHNAFVYALSRGLGYWAPGTKFAEMFVHSAGGPLDATCYSGLTIITDRIKVGPNRVNIFALSPSDVTAPSVTGGYILRIDHPEADTGYYTWTTSQGTTLSLDTPKQNVLVKPQKDYITSYVQQMENAMVSDQASGYATHTYLQYLDRTSWVDYHLLNVFTENDDAFLYSEYFTKDVNGLIKAGPVWDYDRSMGSADGRDDNPLQWTPDHDGDYWNDGWWTYVCHDPDFMQLWIDRWQTLRLSLLANSNLTAMVSSLAAKIGPAAAARDAARWPANQSRFPGGWAGEIANMTSWLNQRAQWIDQQFVAAPLVNVSSAMVVLLPAPGAQIAYTLDGSDPRQSGGALSATAVLSAGPVTLAVSQNFLARSYHASQAGVYPGSPWSSPVGAGSYSANTTGQLTNVSVRTQVGASGGAVLVQGFVVGGTSGGAEQVLIRAVGPALAERGVAGALALPVLSVYDGQGHLLATNSGWSTSANAPAVAAAAAAVGAFPLPEGSADSALLLTLRPGPYTMQVAGQGQSAGVALGETYQVTNDSSQVVNVSCRAQASASAATLTSGFVVAGGIAQVLVRADGPALAQYGLANALAQPVLSVFDAAGHLIAKNTGWSTNANPPQIAAASAAVGAFPLAAGSGDSALLLTVPPGAYTVQISGVGGTTGAALAESYLVPSN